MTYSIVARDPQTGELGVAVQSRAFRVGVCAWARPGVGAVATQSFTDPGYGPRGLELLADGRSPADALAELLAADERSGFRQVAFLDATGRTAAHTGDACIPDCGHLARENLSVQGNMLASPEVWPAAAAGFDAAEGPLAGRLLAALDAAEEAGGDFRGRQAAALLVVSGEGARPAWESVVDLRVDDHPEPLAELHRLYGIWAARQRLAGLGAESSPAEEAELARAAGLREDEVALTEALAEAKRGDLDAAAAALRPLAQADRRWRAALERYERLGVLPEGVVARL
ncbi:MAG TPA: DUF1028 domain-containing protein [Gaiellaceae bacterium]|nr:DUF1028 domain-containing protein [Gaiellaceae bacterium]